jgi:hypothetical protein
MTERDDIPLEELAPEVEAPRNRRRGPRFNLFTGTLGLSLLALAGGFLVVNLVLMPSLTRQGEEVRVPDLTAKSEREAERALASEDLRLSKISEQWSPDIPRGYISRQEPEPGAVVKRGRRISVVVSLGTQGTTVPVLDGESAWPAPRGIAPRYGAAHHPRVGGIADEDPALRGPGCSGVPRFSAIDLHCVRARA